jgi:hypothetical protein
MISINKQDILKTVVIIWFVATTGYVVYDQYASYKVLGIQAAYQQGYADSVSQLIAESQKSQCQPFEVRKDDTKISLVNGACLQSAGEQVQPQAATLKK